jgi:hypothetical protein
MSTKIGRRELPNGEVFVPNCPECTAKAEKTNWPGRLHQAGQPMCRVDMFHEADCPLLPQILAEHPGFAAAPAECNLCEDCTPMFWWEMLSGSTTRLEIRHADDCAAQAATATAGAGAVG